MRYKQLDLNLLVALDVLLQEQNITRAAARLHMTQSAISGILGRLRTYFNDDLLVQVGRKMVPTLLAKELEIPVREILLKIRTSVTERPAFSIAESSRHFRIMASDYLINVLLADFINFANEEAPKVTFEMLSPSDVTHDMLMRGEIDLMIAPEQYLTADHPSEFLFEDNHVCLVWEGNKSVGERLTLEHYLELGHIAAAFGRARTPSIDEWMMNQYGCARKLEVITHDFATMPRLVVGSNRVATMMGRLALLYTGSLPLRLIPPPVDLPVIKELMGWHRSLDRDPMLQWLRDKLKEAALSLGPPPTTKRQP